MFFMNEFGNNLYLGKIFFLFVGKCCLWFIIVIVLVVGLVLVLFFCFVQFFIEFMGGLQFIVQVFDIVEQDIVMIVVQFVVFGVVIKVVVVNDWDICVQIDQMSVEEIQQVVEVFVDVYGVEVLVVILLFIGLVWGENVIKQFFWGFVIFLVLMFLIFVIYFCIWKMLVVVIIGLFDVFVIMVGVYVLVGFEIFLVVVIGFLMIFVYLLYDMMVVFDKIWENMMEDGEKFVWLFGELVNFVVNQIFV